MWPSQRTAHEIRQSIKASALDPTSRGPRHIYVYPGEERKPVTGSIEKLGRGGRTARLIPIYLPYQTSWVQEMWLRQDKSTTTSSNAWSRGVGQDTNGNVCTISTRRGANVRRGVTSSSTCEVGGGGGGGKTFAQWKELYEGSRGKSRMWQYQISTGILYAPDGEIEGHGYSGQPEFKNDPTACGIHNKGPIPPGDYYIGPAFTHPEKGQLCMRLTPKNPHDCMGRDGLMVHGDSIHLPGTASEGCVIQGRAARLALSLSEDRYLKVVI